MKNLYKILLLPALFFAAGCIKDNGNYDYTTESEAITIAASMSRNLSDALKSAFVFKFGDEVKIEVEYTINDKSLSESDLEYQWLLGGEVVSTEKVLSLEPQPMAHYYGIVKVIDTRYNQVYASEFNFQVDPLYTDGLAVLSDNGINSKLHYLNIYGEIENETTVKKFSFEQDIYAAQNNGATLASDAGPLIYHPYDDGVEYGLTIVQGGEDGSIDVNAHDMQPYAKLKNTFLGDVSSLKFKTFIYKECTGSAYAVTDDGDIYMRDEVTYNYKIVPQAGRFSSPYVTEGGCKVQYLVNNSLLSSMMASVNEVFGYDSKNHRCFYLIGSKMYPFTSDLYTDGSAEPFNPGDPGFNGTANVEDITFPGPEDLSGYEVKRMIACGYDVGDMFSDTATTVLVMLLQKDEKNYIFACDFVKDVWMGGLDVNLRMFCEWPVDIDPETIIMPDHMGARNVFFFTDKGNKNIYYYDLDYFYCRKVYTSEDGAITAMRRGETGNGMGMWADAPNIYADIYVVGTESGKIIVLNMDDNAIANGDAGDPLFTAQVDGKITAIEYMPNNMISY